MFQRTDNGSISPELFHFIRELLPDGATILELGSGEGTRELSKFYRTYSIEHDQRWVNKYKSTYIHAPLVEGWYDVEILGRNLPKAYDLILVDGPPAHKKTSVNPDTDFIETSGCLIQRFPSSSMMFTGYTIGNIWYG